MFDLDEQLAKDTICLGQYPLCRVLLMDNRLWRWLILVPERPHVTEIIDLSGDDQRTLIEEIARVSQVLRAQFAPHKLNVASIGNIVPQLHIHVVARYRDDPAWPRPVWGCGLGDSYLPEERALLVARLGAALGTRALDSG